MNIQDEVKKIHHQFGVTEKANYEIQKLFDNRERFIYLLSSDGHRDSVSLNRGSLDLNGLKKILISEEKECYGNEVLEDTITFDDNKEYNWIYFKYRDSCGDIEDGRYGYFKLNII